jgi:hypothetical protein
VSATSALVEDDVLAPARSEVVDVLSHGSVVATLARRA